MLLSALFLSISSRVVNFFYIAEILLYYPYIYRILLSNLLMLLLLLMARILSVSFTVISISIGVGPLFLRSG